MNCFCNGAGFPFKLRWVFLISGAILAGCGNNDVQVYRVAKEAPQSDSQPGPAAGMLPPGHPDMSGGAPKLQWKLPAGWQEIAPGEMRVASFRAAGKDGKQADVSIIPLPGLAGNDLDNVNRWRGQVGQPPVTAEELAKQAQAVEVAGQPAQLYDQAGQNANSGDKTRILAAIQRREGVAWFFKMTGDDALVAEQKPTFTEFLKSLTFTAAPAQPELPPSHPPIDGAPMPAASAASAPSTETKPQWQVPAGWQETQGGTFLVAKFLLSGSDNAQAAVNVSTSPGEGGGLLGNVNRWRQQLGLAPLAESEISKLVTSMDLPEGKATLVDMTSDTANNGQKTRLLAAVVPHAGQTWFYKLMGSESIVAREKDAFSKFVSSVKYP